MTQMKFNNERRWRNSPVAGFCCNPWIRCVLNFDKCQPPCCNLRVCLCSGTIFRLGIRLLFLSVSLRERVRKAPLLSVFLTRRYGEVYEKVEGTLCNILIEICMHAITCFSGHNCSLGCVIFALQGNSWEFWKLSLLWMNFHRVPVSSY